MPAPSLREVFGPPGPLPPKMEHPAIDAALTAPTSPFALEERVLPHNGVLTRTWKNLPRSTRDFFLMTAEAYGPRELVVYEGTSMTYAECFERACLVAHWLRMEFAVRKGDKVGIVMRNLPEYFVAYQAIHLLGGVAVCLNAFSDGDTLAFCVNDVACRALICDPERFARLQAVYPDLDKGKAGTVVGIAVTARVGAGFCDKAERSWEAGKAGPKVFGWEELDAKHKPTVPKGPPQVDVDADDDCIILFTSGTTSRPKGVISTQRANLSCLMLTTYGTARAFLRRGRVPPPPADPKDHDLQSTTLVCIPLFHTTGIHSGMTGSMAKGTRIVIMHKWNVDDAVHLIQKYSCSGILGIGFMVREVVNHPADMPSLEAVAHGGASAAKELPAEADRKAQGMLSGVGYGLTEVNGVACGLFGDDYQREPTSIGLPPAAVELRIVDPITLVTLKDGEQGELWIKGPGNAKGYYNRPEATREAFLPDGWFRTGDLCVRKPENGFYYIVGRAKEMIIRGGENIATIQVEDAVYNHRAIADCAAVPLPERTLGERVAVVCVVRPGEELPSEADVLAAASKSLAPFQRPEYIWIRKEPLERNANGKVDRKVVAKAVAERAAKEGWVPKEKTTKAKL